MEQFVILFFWLAIMLYTGASVLYVYFFVTKRRTVSVLATACTGSGFLLQTVAIGLRVYSTGHLPISGTFGSLLLMTWFMIFVYFVVEHLIRLKTLGTGLVPLAAILLVFAWTRYQTPTELVGLLKSGFIYLHVPVVFVAYGGFTVGAGASIGYLIQQSQLKKRHVNILFRRLPSLDVLDNVASRSITFALPFLSVGLMMGIARAIKAGVPNWPLDPVVLLAGLTWLIYAVYLALRYFAGWTGSRAAVLAMVGFVPLLVNRLTVVADLAAFHRFGA